MTLYDEVTEAIRKAWPKTPPNQAKAALDLVFEAIWKIEKEDSCSDPIEVFDSIYEVLNEHLQHPESVSLDHKRELAQSGEEKVYNDYIAGGTA